MSISGSITFSGLGSGTDFTSMIEALREIEEINMNTMEQWKEDWELRIEAFTQLTDLMTELQLTTADLVNMTDYIKSTSTSSNTNVITTSESDDALEGTYSITVERLATSSVFTSETQFTTDSDGNYMTFAEIAAENETSSTADTYTFSYTLADDTFEFEVSSDDDIQDVLDLINDDPQNPEVTASIIPNGAYGYIFQIQTNETGITQTLEINTTVPGLECSSDSTTGWNVTTAQDAIFNYNGATIHSETNTVTGVINGVTFNLISASDDPVTISVTKDTSELKEKVESWVDCVNQVKVLLQTLTSVDVDADVEDPVDATSQFASQIGSVLTGNYTVQLFSTRLSSLVTSAGIGLTSSTNPTVYSLLSEIGITTDAEESSPTYGQLVIDDTILDDCIENNATAVATLFGGSGGTANSTNFKYDDVVGTQTVPGTYDVSYIAANYDENGGIIDYVAEGETFKAEQITSVIINGCESTFNSETREATVGCTDNDAYGMIIQFSAGVMTMPEEDTETVSYIQGKGAELNSFFAAETRDVSGADDNGAIPIVRSNYEDIVSMLEDDIADELDRIDLWETRQIALYARLEAALGVLEAVMSANASALSSAVDFSA